VVVIIEAACASGVWYQDLVADFPATINYGDQASSVNLQKTVMSDNTENAVDWAS
jgi:hypothetical protein